MIVIMRLRFKRFYFLCSIILFLMLIILATKGATWGLIRSFGGDVLATLWIYCLLAIIVKATPFWLACISFLADTLVEFCQLVAVRTNFNFNSHLLRVIFGSTPDWWDLFAYFIGALMCLYLSSREHMFDVK
ncbi:DUF2809 domain-containing protein [Enterobacter kobei]|nr:DUF2809 domain-containing protein [Enterobacter kobei]